MANTSEEPVPTEHEPAVSSDGPVRSSSRPLSRRSLSHDHDGGARKKNSLQRPPLGERKSSGSIIIPSDSPSVEAHDEQYDEDDARAMSPRRSSDEIEKMGDDARQALEDANMKLLHSQARTLQDDLNEIMTRVESVKSEHEKLEGGNKFLQSYIGELMQTSKIASTGTGKAKSKGRSTK